MKMTVQHWIVIGVAVGAVGLQLAGAKQWGDVLTPSFVGGALVQMAALVKALTLPSATDGQ